KMGKAVPGHFQVLVTKEGYFDKTLEFDFVNGQLLTPVIELRAIPQYTLSGKVVRDDHTGIPKAKVIVQGNGLEYETECDVNGDFIFPAIFEGTYEIEAGIWNYIHESQVDLFQPINKPLEATKGYKDDFDLDLGWTVSGTATNGVWVRDVPQTEILGTTIICGSDGDSQNDNGPYAFTTGASASSGFVTDSEVDGGVTWLSSPPMDFSIFLDPAIAFDYWLCEFPPNMFHGVHLWLTNGVDTVLLEEFHNDTIAGSWQSKYYAKIYDHIDLPAPIDSVQLLISAEDTTTGIDPYIIKMHFDNFKMIDGSAGTKDEMNSSASFLFYPNPLSGSRLYLKPQTELKGNVVTIQITDPQGRMVQQQSIARFDFEKGIDVRLPEGMYFIQWKTDKNESGAEKLLVLKQ
ncbi:MAG TPA: T9SS type A sorting domain-containing protein, partial [Saprospiraceae bacterium]|nr:T9SS type A sorting domain-containing protein [Saprospiraceae bacterium]